MFSYKAYSQTPFQQTGNMCSHVWKTMTCRHVKCGLKRKKTCGSVTFGGSVIIKAGQELSHSTSCIFIRWVLYTLGTLPAFHWDRLSRSSTVQENTCGAVWYFRKNRLLLISSPPVWIRGTALDPPTVCVCVLNVINAGRPCLLASKKKYFYCAVVHYNTMYRSA